MGLAVAKQLVVLMEGPIGVESQPGEGSVFWFTARLEKQAGDATAPEASRRDLSDLRVLAVDDNAINPFLAGEEGVLQTPRRWQSLRCS